MDYSLVKDISRDLVAHPLGAALLSWLSKSPEPVRVVYATRENMGRGEPVDATWHDGAFIFSSSFMNESTAGLSATAFILSHTAFILSHDIGHVLAATDEQVVLPNLGLPLGDTVKVYANECRAIVYQIALIRALIGSNTETERLIDTLIQTAWALFKMDRDTAKEESSRITLEEIQAEWNRKMQICASMNLAAAA